MRQALLLLTMLALLTVLSACTGTLAVGVEQTPTPDMAPRATLEALIDENERLQVALATALAPPPPAPTGLGRVAYIRGGDLWLTQLPDGAHQRLTIDGYNREPRISSSGEWIAYRKDRTVLIQRDRPCEDPLREGEPPCRETVSTFQQQVWLARRNGGEQHVINRGLTVERCAWSPTADLLAYVTEDGHLQTLDATNDIVLRLVSGNTSGRVIAIAWSPDGLRVAYEWLSDEPTGLGPTGAGPSADDGIWVISATGGQPIRLLRDAGVPATLAGWRDPEHVLFWRHRTESTEPEEGVALYAAALARPGSGPMVIEETPMLPREDFIAVAPVAPRTVAATVGAGLPTWTNKRVVAGAFETPANLAAMAPAWSPDGSRLLFVASPDQPELTLGEGALAALLSRHVWVAELASGAVQQLTEDSRYRDERPLASRLGSHVLFARMTGQGQTSLWIIPLEGGTPVLVVDELTPAPDPIGTYGFIDWSQHYDWWRG